MKYCVQGYLILKMWLEFVSRRLATGSCNRNIHLWQLRDSSSWHVDQRPLNAHTDSVEDIQWSPNEKNVMSSLCSDFNL